MKKFLIVICLIIGIGIVCEFGFNSYNPYETKCVEAGCNNERVEGSIYCKEHKPSEKDTELDDCLHDMVPYEEDTTEETTKETTTYSYHNSSSSSSYGGSSSYSNSSSSYGGSSSYSNSSSSYGGSRSYSSSTKKKSSSSTSGYSSYSSGSSSSSPYKSYDEGYEAVYDDDDYDWDRYNSDSDYAEGVDDALDELDD